MEDSDDALLGMAGGSGGGTFETSRTTYPTGCASLYALEPNGGMVRRTEDHHRPSTLERLTTVVRHST